MEEATFVIVGGGIAGVSCAELLPELAPEENVILITASPTIKAVTNLSHLTPNLKAFDVEEINTGRFSEKHSSVKVLKDTVLEIEPERKELKTKGGKIVKYQKLCLCNGARPKLISPENPNVLGIRDTESVKQFQEKLKNARRVAVIGNGGIATELVYELEAVDVLWAIKDDSITATFVDPGAGQFFLNVLMSGRKDSFSKDPNPVIKRLKYTESADDGDTSEIAGGALGPDWHSKIKIDGALASNKFVKVETEVEIVKVMNSEEFKPLKRPLDQLKDKDEGNDWPVFVELTNGKIYGCDFIVSATGVMSNGDHFGKDLFELSPDDGGIIVNDNLESSVKDIFAAGDVCHLKFKDHPKHFLQMKLWTQARLLGMYAAQCLDSSLKKESRTLDFSFEMFSHVTKFFGFKVILLGLFNAQGFEKSEYEALVRVIPGVEYIKAVMVNGRMQGAILIGETDLEETFENLILNQMDLSALGDGLLDPNVDIEDYFD